jgi:hypothetical protein
MGGLWSPDGFPLTQVSQFLLGPAFEGEVVAEKDVLPRFEAIEYDSWGDSGGGLVV